MTRTLFTSESVTEGHPDKICDQISDSILDEILKSDPNARVACETFVTTGLVLVSGEISTKCNVDITEIVRKTIKDIGYVDARYGFDYKTCSILTSIDKQSPDIAIGVDYSFENRKDESKNDFNLGAGDQGIMFGYANKETEELMPMPIVLAHKLSYRLSEVRKNRRLKYLGPDGKTQVTVEYQNGKPVRVDTIVLSTQHTDEVLLEALKKDINEYVIKPTIPDYLIDNETKYFINPTGRFVIGGPKADTGLTGRKIMVDTYGGYSRHGGGAFSGKDPTKVDRSAAYAARYIAKNIVAAGLADKCEIQLGYAIGVAEPVSILVNTFDTGIVFDRKIEEVIKKCFILTPTGIIKHLDLLKPIYKHTASYGHFGRSDIEFPWEKTDKAKILRQMVNSF